MGNIVHNNETAVWVKAVSLSVLLLCPQISSAQQAEGRTLELEFRPPQLEPLNICISREPDAVTEAVWQDWDGEKLPDLGSDLIKRDFKRLKQIDAQKWLPTILQIITRLEEADPRFSSRDALSERISAMEAAGDFEGLRNQQLVAQLAESSDGLSPRLKNSLSHYLRVGMGVPQDIERANGLLMEAGYSGNADALLALSKMQLNGEQPAGWDVPEDLAVTMAFGSLVGAMDSSICDRASRIAREYNSGEIVKADRQLAHDWYRFTADLGDENGAWKVVEYHLEAEGFQRDNEVMLTYLTQAADAGLTFAQIELGRQYETGALLERDLNQTLELFRSAATSGARPGLTRVALFLETYADLYPELEEERLTNLRALAALPDAPGWVFSRLAEDEVARRGRWAGHAQAVAYLEEATALGDLDGSVNLAKMLIAQQDDRDDFERAVDILSNAVSEFGGVTPIQNLYGALMCQAVDSPRLSEAAHWQRLEQATDTANVDIPAQTLISLTAKNDPLQIAEIQSQALYGRPTALASYLKLLEYSDEATPEMRAFWAEYSGKYTDVLKALAKLELELAQTDDQRLVAIALLRKEYQEFGAPAALALARALIDHEIGTTSDSYEVRAILEGPAKAGKGLAMQLLAALDVEDETGVVTYERFEGIIAANGDFDALIFAIPFLTTEHQDRYLRRAAGVMPCDYKNVMSMVRALLRIGRKEQANHWLGISEHLLDGNPWAYADLAKKHLNVNGEAAAPKARQLFEVAYAKGDPTAALGLFDLLIMYGQQTYDPDRAAQMVVRALDEQNTDTLSGYLARYRRAEAAAKNALEVRLDMPEAYRVAAGSGNVVAMRTYAMHLRDSAQNAQGIAISTQWLGRAAEGGDTNAMVEYGYALAFGIGVEVDTANAVYWLDQAAQAGSEKANELTKLLKLKDGA
jgi:TPR repeat protein